MEQIVDKSSIQNHYACFFPQTILTPSWGEIVLINMFNPYAASGLFGQYKIMQKKQ